MKDNLLFVFVALAIFAASVTVGFSMGREAQYNTIVTYCKSDGFYFKESGVIQCAYMPTKGSKD